MKRIIGRILLLIPVSLILILAWATVAKKAKAEEAAGKIKTFPQVIVTDIYGRTFNTSHVKRGPLLITFFHPDCEFCRYEITSITSCDQLNEKLTIVLVSYADKTEMKSFIQQQGIIDSSGMYIIQDIDFMFTDLFGADIVPANYIYDDSLRLVKVYKGSVRPETILKYLKEND